MNSSSSSTRGATGTARPVVRPQPYLVRTVIQLIGWSILVAAGLRLLLRWSGYRTGDALLDQALVWVATEPRTAWLNVLALLPLGWMLGEGILAGLVLRTQTRRYDHAPAPALRRILLPQAGTGAGQRPSRTPDQDLFRAIAGAIEGAGRRSGRAPWAAWTLQGAPQEPVTLGVAVGAADSRHAAQCAANVGAALQGLAPLGLVEAQADPLRAQLTAGRTAVWQHWTLALGSQYPLRLLDDVEQSPPLAGLLSALRPFGGIVASESQLVVQAATGRGDWTLRRGWRGATTALKLGLEAKHDFALRDDVAALDAKLLGVPYVVTVRVVVVAAGANADADAQRLLDQYGAALGAYQLRVGSAVQRFVAGRVRRWTVTPGGVPPCALRRALQRAPEPTTGTPILLPTLPAFWPEPLGLSSAELGGLWHLPTATLGPLVRWMSCRVLAAPPHAFIDEEHAL